MTLACVVCGHHEVADQSLLYSSGSATSPGGQMAIFVLC